jgi:hypothetical protein
MNSENKAWVIVAIVVGLLCLAGIGAMVMSNVLWAQVAHDCIVAGHSWVKDIAGNWVCQTGAGTDGR